MPNRKGGAGARARRNQRNNARLEARRAEKRRRQEESLQTNTVLVEERETEVQSEND